MPENIIEKTTNPKVSIIIPCYNQGKYVAEAIQSALDQTYENVEIVVVNDGSTDNSSEIIQQFADKYKNILFFDNKENNGVIFARNMAVDACSGDYILPLDADDIIEPTYVEKAENVLSNNSNIGIVYCRAKLFGSIEKEWKLSTFDKSKILYENCIFCSALFRKTDFIKLGGYKDYMAYGCEDYDLWLSFIEQHYDVYQIDEVLFNYRRYEECSRSKLSEKDTFNYWKQIIKNHINLYLNDKSFFERLFIADLENIKKIQKKHKKYKKLFNILLPITLCLTVMLLVVIILSIWRLNV